MVHFTNAVVALSTASVATAAATEPKSNANNFVKRIVSQRDDFFQGHVERRSLKVEEPKESSSRVGGFQSRQLQLGDQQATCDIAFLNCLPSLGCVDCFAALELESIDWAGVTPDTSCDDVVGYLTKAGFCKALEGDKYGTNAFCDTFHACVIWTDDDDEPVPPEDQDGFVDCSALTECKWDGMKTTWIGDGVCNDNMHGCYNTAVCNYDGGDCCEDTCDAKESEFKTCGQDGYVCRDPEADGCNPNLTTKCKKKSSVPDPKNTTCTSSEQKYKLVLYDSFGDGWDNTELLIRPVGSSRIVHETSLKEGFEGTEYICLSQNPVCYEAFTGGGMWGIESSWELKPMREGAPAFAGAGAPSDCVFPVAGADCENTCDGKPKDDPTQDKSYKDFKQLYNCISEKCVIQMGACEIDPKCDACFDDDTPEYCYSMDAYIAVVDCTMCSCSDSKDSEICSTKNAPGTYIPPDADKDNDNSAPVQCSSAETRAGAKAVVDFAKCANMDQIGIMVSEYDQANFGQLDQFEACAHAYNDEDNHGGHSALGCMGILYGAIKNPVAADNQKNPPKEAISTLANDIYQNGQSFCDCAKGASDDCPLCPGFMNFKSLLYETLDACNALDMIDCAAWGEFYKPCEDNVLAQFTQLDLDSRDQCQYIKDGCGGAGPFPAFRHLNCDTEISKDAWQFYRRYEKGCLRGDDGIPPSEAPNSSPSKAPSPTSGPSPTKAPATPQSLPTRAPAVEPTLVPYNPSDDDSIAAPTQYNPSSGTDKKSKSHWFRNLVILGLVGGGGYYLYKRRFDNNFNFMQYRRVRNFGNFGGYDDGSSAMYSNLNSSTSFEPPSLPPTPQMMGGQPMMQGYMGATEMT